MAFFRGREEKARRKEERRIEKENLEKLEVRLVSINKEYLEGMDELKSIRENIVSKNLYQKNQDEQHQTILKIQKDLDEKINTEVNNLYDKTTSKFQEISNNLNETYQNFLNLKIQEQTDAYSEYIEKITTFEKELTDLENIKNEFHNLMESTIALQTELEKFKLLEESYRDIALALLEEKMSSREIIKEIANKGSEVILEKLNDELEEFNIKEQRTFVDAIREIFQQKEITHNFTDDKILENEVEPFNNEWIFHESYHNAKAIVDAGVIPMVVGPAGSGKSHAMKQLASHLGLRFKMANRIQNTFELVGFQNAEGKYMPTQFYEAYKNGGLFFFDEVDASSPEALVTINAAIAQGHMAFPGHSKNIVMHDDFKAVVAGNTYGTGSTWQYTGRNKLDAATLDRFMIVDWGYDVNLEEKLISDKELLAICWEIRESLSVLKEEYNQNHLNRRNDFNPYDSIIISTRGIEILNNIFKASESMKKLNYANLFEKKFFSNIDAEYLTNLFEKLNEVSNLKNNKYFPEIKKALTT